MEVVLILMPSLGGKEIFAVWIEVLVRLPSTLTILALIDVVNNHTFLTFHLIVFVELIRCR